MVAWAAAARWRHSGGAGAGGHDSDGNGGGGSGGGARAGNSGRWRRWSTRRSGRAHSRARPRLSDAQGSNLRAPSLVELRSSAPLVYVLRARGQVPE